MISMLRQLRLDTDIRYGILSALAYELARQYLFQPGDLHVFHRYSEKNIRDILNSFSDQFENLNLSAIARDLTTKEVDLLEQRVHELETDNAWRALNTCLRRYSIIYNPIPLRIQTGHYWVDADDTDNEDALEYAVVVADESFVQALLGGKSPGDRLRVLFADPYTIMLEQDYEDRHKQKKFWRIVLKRSASYPDTRGPRATFWYPAAIAGPYEVP